MTRIDYNAHLNQEQLQAVDTLLGPVLVIAGAGSGKTRTLVFRVARLIEEGVPPGAILLLTFTRKAAQEMLRRAGELVGPHSHMVQGGTFHSFCYGRLREYGHLIGYPSTFTVLDRRDSEDLFGLLVDELGIKDKAPRFPKKGTIAAIHSKTMNTGKGVEWVLERGYPHLLRSKEAFEALFEAYDFYKARHGLMDYDDLLVKWRGLLVEHEDVRKVVSERYQFIMVDEFQDTNKVQAELVRLMAFTHDNVMAVGDDAQSIYSFRGAHYRNILDFPKLFQGARIIKLETNYRTHQPNLDCTNAIILNAKEKFSKRLVAVKKGGAKPILYCATDEFDQARFVVDRIKDFLIKGVPPREIAVLFRASFHGFKLEGELNRCGIKYVKRGGLKLLEGAHIKDFLALLRVMVNPLDRLGLRRAFTLVPGLGEKGVDRIYAHMLSSDDPLTEVLNFKTKAKWGQPLKDLVKGMLEIRKGEQPLRDVLIGLMELYEPFLQELYVDDYPRRLQELNELVVLSRAFSDPGEFLTEIALDPPGEEEIMEEGDAVVLSTVHSAKGLEWSVVFVISLVDGRFPSQMALERADDLEEERRLFYVAATRAKENLFFCSPDFITVSRGGMLPASRSMFLREIPASLLSQWRNKSPHFRGLKGDNMVHSHVVQEDAFRAQGGDTAKATIKTGARIRHHVFGPGTVVADLGHDKFLIDFDGPGQKTINAKVARVSII